MKFKEYLSSKGKIPPERLGFTISFAGSLPPGVITLGVLQASVAGGALGGLSFSLGALCVEAAFVWLTLVGMGWLSGQTKWLKALQWFSLSVMASIAIGAAWAIFHPKPAGTAVVLYPSGIPLFAAGILLRFLTPTMVPYWLGFNTALLTQKLLVPDTGQYRVYVAGISGGTFAAHLVVIMLGTVAQEALRGLQTGINWLIFIALGTASLIQTWKLLAIPKKELSK